MSWIHLIDAAEKAKTTVDAMIRAAARCELTLGALVDEMDFPLDKQPLIEPGFQIGEIGDIPVVRVDRIACRAFVEAEVVQIPLGDRVGLYLETPDISERAWMPLRRVDLMIKVEDAKTTRPVSDPAKMDVIAGLALALANCAPKYKRNETPNQKQIADAVAALIDQPSGTIRNVIGEALKLHS